MFSTWRNSIRTEILFYLIPGLLFILMLFILTIIIMSTSQQNEAIIRQTQETTRHYASEVQVQMRAGLEYVETVATVMENYHSRDRAEVNAMLRQFIIRLENFVGLSLGFEPNAFDGRDSHFRGTPGSDANGRFLPYWNRISGKIGVEPLVNYQTDDWYQIPKATHTSLLTEPYLYRGVLMATFSAPIIRQDKFLGVATGDVSLEYLSEMITRIKLFESGYAFMVSNKGTIIAHKERSLVGHKSLTEYGREAGGEGFIKLAEQIQRGEDGFIETEDPETHHPILIFFSPMKTGNWSFIAVVPRQEALAGVRSLTLAMLLIGLAALLLMTGLVFLVATKITTPIKEVAERMKNAHINTLFNSSRPDEIGELTRAFDRFATSVKSTILYIAQSPGGKSSAPSLMSSKQHNKNGNSKKPNEER